MKRQALLLAVLVLTAQTPTFAFGLGGLALGAGGHVIDHNKKLQRTHPYGSGMASGAVRGAQIGSFVGLPFVGAGVGAAVGGVRKLFHRRH
jgi:hypothetical protein